MLEQGAHIYKASAFLSSALARVCQPLVLVACKAFKMSLSSRIVTWDLFCPEGRPRRKTTASCGASHVSGLPCIWSKISCSFSGLLSLIFGILFTLKFPSPYSNFCICCRTQRDDPYVSVVGLDNDHSNQVVHNGTNPKFSLFTEHSLVLNTNGKLPIKSPNLIKRIPVFLGVCSAFLRVPSVIQNCVSLYHVLLNVATFNMNCNQVKNSFSAYILAALFVSMAGETYSAEIDPKTRGMLDFIGTIEGPAGYDDYYRGVSSGPPRPLTSMSIREVLAWQDSIDASSKSEAAGRYQIMEDTLRELVVAKGIDQNRRFDGATQDELAVLLLKRRGWDTSRTDYVKMGNPIAHEWAALPLCSGIKTGKSAYDGLAGNSALTTCEAYLTVLEFGTDPQAVAWALTQSVVGTAGTGGTARVRNILNDFIEDYKNTFYSLSQNLVVIATSLLFSMILIEWLMTTMLLVIRGTSFKEYLSALILRVVLAGVFLFIINLGSYSDLVIRSADGLLDQTSSGATINIVELFDRILAMTFDLFGRSTIGIAEKFASILVLIVGTMIIAMIVMSYMEVYLSFGAAFIALGFGGYSGTRHLAINYLKRVVGRVFRLFTALFCGAIMSVLLGAELEPSQGDAMLLVGVLVILFYIILQVPSAVEQAVVGTVSISAAETLGRSVQNAPRNLAQKGGLPGA